MWVEFHSKAHGIWWMSWNIIKKKHENSSKRTLPQSLSQSGLQESYKLACVMDSSKASGRDSNKNNNYYIHLWKEYNIWQRRPKHVQNTPNLGKSIYKPFFASQDLLLNPRTTKHIWAALFSFFFLFFSLFLFLLWLINRKQLHLITMRYKDVMYIRYFW